ncbi:MAG: glycosyltransferase [Candidatus Margulisbacteria bacterium]|nr:glycosyltransferase [Candidatus Margulisiibacteriota bacterium]
MEGGGAERVVLNLANEFFNREISFVLILRFKKGPYLKELNSGIKIIELNANNPILLISRLIKSCNSSCIDTLLTVSRYNNVIGLVANRFLKKRIIIREASTFNELFTGNSIKYKILFKLMKIYYPSANMIIANSKDTAKDIISHISINKEKLVVINNPIVNEKILKLSNEIIGDEFFSELSKPIIISIGRLFPSKNYSFLIRSFKKVATEVPNINLVILGEGPLKKQLIDLSKVLRIEKNVHFFGFVNNPYKYLKHSDVFVLSSTYEGFGNVIVEALAVGIPVVSSDCPGGPKEILDNGKYGKLIPINDEDAMADALISTLRANIDKKMLIERSKLYSIKKITDEYCEVIFQ